MVKSIYLLVSVIFAVVFLSSFSFFDNKNPKTGLSKVNKMDGVEVYFMSEPLRKYTVVIQSDAILGNASVKSLASGGLSTPTISDKANRLVKNTVNNANKDGKSIDAIVYTSGKSVVGVKFTDEPNENTSGIGKVNKINGVDVYVFAEPLVPYEELSEGKAKAHGGALMTAGIVNSSIEDDLTKLVENTKDEETSAVMYSSGKKGLSIKYK